MDVKSALLLIPDLRNPECHGGIQVFNNLFLRALTELGVETTVVGLNDRPEDRVPGLITCSGHGGRSRLAMIRHAAWHCLRHRPDLVICGHRNFSPAIAPIARLTGRPMLAITHGRELWDASPAQLKAMGKSAAILAVSRYTRGLILEAMPNYPPEQVVVFHNTYAEDRFTPASPPEGFRASMGLNEDDFVVLTVGRIASQDPGKGYEEGIRAVAEVVKKYPNVRYVLAGRGDDMDRLRGIADETGLGDRLIMPGFVADDDLRHLFRACDLFMLPSWQEGFGIVFIEAMACGKPVIGGNRDGSMDPMCDGELGTPVDPKNRDELVEAITAHIEGRVDAIKRDPEHLHAEVRRRFGFDAFRERLRGVLEQM